ncbi:type IV pilus twitching motility protein PilT [Paraliomyxa miuraensis]|uniref:type IV pilus twitching motility protein PilT n=1 Tax=Paraliomyxa miuraensis TaxID=376150 RepID=UPI00224EC63E|nr:PilT/PilU family type 4a pilus ATPase [Paraliomyxa miuraensis]MCX4240936.1 PilT/PilU family type 4a pilus ATPase [Paraliomyxa miuraensis]
MPAIDALFDQLLTRGGSDLHLSIGYPPTIRLRGRLEPLRSAPVDAAEMDQLLLPLLDDERRREFERERDLDFAYAYGQRARFRANYLVKTTGPGAVFRTIPSKIPSVQDLRVPEAIVRLAERRAGLVLVTGPTGSGKSTTLAALISHINHSRAGHILTIEDPVEFVHQPARCQVTHREVGVHCPSFADAIRSAGRENADVILVGELRGQETMRLALQLASFGVLVFATVHTNSAPATIDRFVNAFPASQQPAIRGMLSDALAGIVAQQLLRTADGRGRVAVHEILVGTLGVASAIRERKTAMIGSLIQAGGREGMQSLDRALQNLVEAGTVNAHDALDKAVDKEAFARIPAVRERLDRE